MDVAKKMRRLFGPPGEAAGQDVMVAAGADSRSDADSDNEARAVRRKAKKQGDMKGKRGE